MLRGSAGAVLWALLLLGPLLDPHAADPYHPHYVVGRPDTAVTVWPVHGGPAARSHPPGVAWLRASDPSGPAALHGSGLLHAAAAVQPFLPPEDAGLAFPARKPLYDPVALEPPPPPPRPA